MRSRRLCASTGKRRGEIIIAKSDLEFEFACEHARTSNARLLYKIPLEAAITPPNVTEQREKILNFTLNGTILK